MMRKQELYSYEELASLKKRKAAAVAVAAAIALVTLALAIVCCIKADRHAPKEMLIRAIVISTVGGWIVISLVHFLIDELTYAIKHSRAMLEGEKEEVGGRFKLTDERWLVKRGVAITEVKAEPDDPSPRAPVRLQIYDKKKKRFDEAAVRVETCHGFITAFYTEGGEAL